MIRKTKTDAIERYLNALDMNSDFLFSEDKFKSDVDEIGTYLELTYGDDEKHKLLNLVVDNDYERKTSIGRMKAFLLSLNNKSSQRSSSKTKVKPIVQNNIQSTDELNSVFIVHGHDKEAKETVARFVEKLGLRSVILHEQPNNGKTLIDKLERDAEGISFAVVLLTPDDKGAPVNSDDMKYRARQNVIYELGFFNAKLSRARVCVLKKGDVEVLSDYLGVVYVEMDDNGAWKNQLVREMKAAGLSVSLENLERALLS